MLTPKCLCITGEGSHAYKQVKLEAFQKYWLSCPVITFGGLTTSLTLCQFRQDTVQVEKLAALTVNKKIMFHTAGISLHRILS